jgi:hypothetical protein
MGFGVHIFYRLGTQLILCWYTDFIDDQRLGVVHTVLPDMKLHPAST